MARTGIICAINEEQVYLVIAGNYKGKIYHVTYGSNKQPLIWINWCLACQCHSSS